MSRVDDESMWEDLLDDLLQAVLLRAGGKSVETVRRVCSSWMRKVNSLLRDRVFHIGKGIAVDHIVQRFPALVHLTLDFRGYPQRPSELDCLSALPLLEFLELRNLEGPCGTPVSLGGLSNLPNLGALTLRRCRFSSQSDLDKLTQLQTVKFLMCVMDACEPPLVDALKSLKNLKQLQIDSCRPSSRICLKGIGKLSGLQHAALNVSDVACDEIAQELGKLYQMRVLDISVIRCVPLRSITDTGLGYVTNLKKLRSLNLGGHYCLTNSGIKQLSALSHLNNLDLSIPGPIAESLAANSLLLENVQPNVHPVHQIDDDGLQHLAHLKSISSLALRYTMVSCNFIHHILPQLLHLHLLSLSHCSNVDDSTCFQLGSCKNLRILDISFCHISDLGIRGLASTLFNLQELDLTGSLGHISSRGLRNLQSLQALSWLSLAHCENVADRGLHELACSARSLAFLSLKGCVQVTVTGIEVIGRELCGLKELVLIQCYEITDAVASVLKNMPRIELVHLSHGVLSAEASQGLADIGIAVITSKGWWM